MIAIASPLTAAWSAATRVVESLDHEPELPDEYVPASRGAPRASRDISLHARREQDAALYGR